MKRTQIIIGLLFAFVTLVHCQWMCDHNRFVTVNENNVTYNSFHNVNCIYHTRTLANSGNTLGTKYYEFTVHTKSYYGFFGVSTMDSLKKEMNAKGIYFSGRLWDGVNSFDNYPTTNIVKGDKIGILIEKTQRTLNVYFFVNRHPLGLAYTISPRPTIPIFPAVKFGDRNSVTLVELTTIPTQREKEQVTLEEGFYKLLKFAQNGGVEQLVSQQLQSTVEFKVHMSSPKRYVLGKKDKVAPTSLDISCTMQSRSLYFSLHFQNGKWDVGQEYTGEKWEKVHAYGPISNTHQSAERFITSVVENFYSYEFDAKSRTITIYSKSRSKLVLSQTRQFSYTPQITNPF